MADPRWDDIFTRLQALEDRVFARSGKEKQDEKPAKQAGPETPAAKKGK
jgi:hypothetical protein